MSCTWRHHLSAVEHFSIYINKLKRKKPVKGEYKNKDEDERARGKKRTNGRKKKRMWILIL